MNQDQLKILIAVLSVSVEKHGANKLISLGHLLNICKLCKRFEAKIEEREDQEHRELINEISDGGQF